MAVMNRPIVAPSIGAIARRWRIAMAEPLGAGSERSALSGGADSGPDHMLTGRALVVGERINTAGLERGDVYSTAPLAFRVGERGFVAVYRHGVVVLIGLTPIEEDEALRGLGPRIIAPNPPREDEIIRVRLAPEGADNVTPDGVISLRSVTPEHLLVVADILAKSAALDADERQVAKVFDIIEPFARPLAETGRAPGGRRAMLKLIGEALIVKARVAGRVAALEKPDVLWDRPDLDRLWGRLEDEYEIRERAETLNAKLAVIGDTATALTDLIHTERSLRLELIIVVLIAVEIAFSLAGFFGVG
jgi:uncharacterized Rmd1/YagE family protein